MIKVFRIQRNNLIQNVHMVNVHKIAIVDHSGFVWPEIHVRQLK